MFKLHSKFVLRLDNPVKLNWLTILLVILVGLIYLLKIISFYFSMWKLSFNLYVEKQKRQNLLRGKLHKLVSLGEVNRTRC